MQVNLTGTHIRAIDGLRAVAVLSIIVFHFHKDFLPGGFVGVDIFFVISGFVVAISVQSTKDMNFIKYFAWFYRRRILRVVPASLVFTIVTMLLSALFIPFGYESRDIYYTGMASLFGLANVILYIRSGNYFGMLNEYNPFTHMWSLGVEEQYYLLFPFFSYFLLVSSRVDSRFRTAAENILVALFLVSLAAWAFFGQKHPTFTFYMIVTRLWELLAGFALAYAFARSPETIGLRLFSSVPSGTAAAAVGAAILAVSFVAADEAMFPFPWALAPAGGTLLLIASSVRSRRNFIAALLASPPAVAIGRISYSLYLWHWVVIVLLRWTIGSELLRVQAAAAVLTLALSWASYALVEKPIRYVRVLQAIRYGPFYAGFAAVMFVAATSSVAIWAERHAISLSVTADEQTWSPHSHGLVLPGGCQVAVKYDYYFHNGSRIEFSPYGCSKPFAHQVFALGDSHAGAYERNAYRLASDTGSPVTIWTGPSCEPPLSIVPNKTPACGDFVSASLKDIASKAGAEDVLFLPGLYLLRYQEWDEKIAGLITTVAATDLDDAKHRFEVFLKPLIDRGMRIVIEAPKPLMKSAVYRCADEYTQWNRYCRRTAPSRKDIEMRRTRALAFQTHVLAQAPSSIAIWDPLPVLCPGSICQGMIDGKPLYMDTDHLSAFGNDLLYESLRKALQ